MEPCRIRAQLKRVARERIMRDLLRGYEPMSTQANSKQAADFLEGILEAFQLTEGIEEERLREGWRKIAGDFIASQTQVVSLKHGMLTLRVVQPAMRFHLEQSRRDLLQKLQRELGDSSIREIRLVTG